MKFPDGYKLHEADPMYFVEVNGRIVWPSDPKVIATKQQAEIACGEFDGGIVVSCNLLFKQESKK